MKVTAKFAKESILNRNGLNHLQIELVPPTLEKKEDRKPVLMIFILDRSGSMSEVVASANKVQRRHERSSKMDYAINASTKFLSLLTEKDLFGVVSFDDMAFVEQPLTNINNDNLSSVVANIRSIHPRGCTNISDALLTAKKMITSDHKEKYNCKLVLLSDGEANQGICHADGLSSIALECMAEGITVTSLGIGLDYNSKLMGSIAQSGGGLIHHIEDLSQLGEIFKEELDLSSIITAKKAKVLLEIPDLIEIGENLNNYPQKIVENNIEILVGDIHNSRKILLEVRNNFVDEDITFNLKTLYKSLEGNDHEIKTVVTLRVVANEKALEEAKKNEDVISEVLALVKDRTIVDTAEMFDVGDVGNIGYAFASAATSVKNMCDTYAVESESLMLELEDLNTSYQTNKVSRSMAKAMYAESRKKTRK